MKKQTSKIVQKHWWRLSYVGLLFALLFLWISLLPSLLPRPWLYQGFISGVSIAVGYGIGVLTSALIRWMFDKEFPKKYKPFAWKLFLYLSPFIILILLWLGSSWQNEVHSLVGEPALARRSLPQTALVAFLVFVLLIVLARGIKKLYRTLSKIADKFLPRNIGKVLAYGFIVLFFYWIISGVLLSAFVDVSNNIYRSKNATTPPEVSQPTSPYRSGSAESLIPWETLGYQGKAFVARGPSQDQLANYAGQSPVEQIRAYVGLDSANSVTERAQLAVKELERTDAFSRDVLVLATVTGTGWLEPQSVDSIEYMYGGNTAIVAQQYSYLPSWISFLVDQQNATDAGQALYNAVYAKWVNLPKDSRPKLIAYGLSLGSFGGQAAYTSAQDLAISIDGALFMGTPSNTRLWRSITDNRDAGSPEWQPKYQNGTTVRFAATNEDILSNQGNWQFPRILYMQHASDPVVWFDFRLIANEPNWLTEPRGPDVSPKTHWYPFVTFLQVTVDQFFGVNVPNGHGHNYPNTIVNAWGAVVPPNGWDTTKAVTLQNIVNTYSNE